MKSFLEVAKPQPKEPQKGIYMCAKFDDASNEQISQLQSKLGVANPVQPHKLHTTLAYSRKMVDVFPGSNLNEYARLISLEVWDTKYGKTVVGNLDSPYLHGRFNDIMSLGATYDYDEYRPHVTLAYDAGDVTVEQLNERAGLPIDLRIIGEESEELDLDKDVNDITGTDTD